ncbi:MAG: hypothetical protein GOVbin631_93 [Prokaryotic dsDNA virus sp.]|nr:MAG: hypothetical protein GOVbin631_93 [Prokaryotic dsDNA virus sp.]|tara:strand:- start:41852 stop:42472 length:621 start_codon:yes stop_codon:yes gene_type:complete
MTITKQIFKAPNREGTANELASHMPDGIAWESKYKEDTNLRGLVYGMSTPINTTEQLIEELSEEFDINQTTLLIDEWEKSVGLPDECFGVVTDIETRRQLVLDRIKKSPLVTLSELQSFVNAFLDGITVTLYPGKPYYSLPYRLPQHLIGDVAKRFILVAEVDRGGESLPYKLPQQLVRGIDEDRIRCLLEKVIPANVYLIIETRS